MALPVAPPPKSNDVAVVGWSGLTVRIAWTLLVLGVKVRPDVLRDARAHVLYHVDPATPLPHAEDLATRLTEEFVARARGQLPSDPWASDWEMPLTPRWRRAVEKSADPASAAVFLEHYGDERSLAWIEQHLKLDRVAIEALQHGLREVVRGIAVADGLPVETWAPERVDRLLRRLAAFAPGPCPPLLDVAEGCHRDHVATCPRCDRTLRLIHAGLFTVDDLFAPSVGARPHGRARVVALHFHPDGRRSRRRLVEELGIPVFPLGDDRILLDGAHLERIAPVLVTAAQVGSPRREHLRGLLLDGPGTWTERGLLGPLAERAAREVLHRSWGKLDGVGDLPEVLPEAPSAWRVWAAAGVAAAGVAALAAVALGPAGDRRAPTFTAEFVPGRGGTWAAFDVPERAIVTVVGQTPDGLVPVFAGTGAEDKAQFATGDGSYRVHVPGRGALVAVSDRPLELDAALASASRADAPLEALAAALSAQGDVRWTDDAAGLPFAR